MSLARFLRYTLVCCGFVLVMAAVVASAKLLPFALNAGVAFRTIGPLAAAAFATVVEVAVLLGTPMGFALAAQRALRHRAADSAVGFASPARVMRVALFAGLVWSGIASVLGGAANVHLATPGRVANKLIGAAREVCLTSRDSAYVTVPMLGNRWKCAAKGPPTLVGEITRAAAGTSYSASQMSLSDDLTYVELIGLRLTSPAVNGRPALRLAVDGARLHGVWPLARPARLGDLGRAVFVSLTASLLGLLATCLIGLRSHHSRLLACAFGLVLSLSAWVTLLSLDERELVGRFRYAYVPLSGCVMALCLFFLTRSLFFSRIHAKVFRRQADANLS